MLFEPSQPSFGPGDLQFPEHSQVCQRDAVSERQVATVLRPRNQVPLGTLRQRFASGGLGNRPVRVY